jgi:hypothetical protein
MKKNLHAAEVADQYKDYERKTYATAKIWLEEGWYTRARIEEILAGMDAMNIANIRSMEKICGTP